VDIINISGRWAFIISTARKGFDTSGKEYTRLLLRAKTRKEFEKKCIVCANCYRKIKVGITQLPKEISE